jgi:hypothetical protein
MISNFKKCQFSVYPSFNFNNLLDFFIKFCQNSQNTLSFFFIKKKKLEKFSKIQAYVFLQIPLNFDQHLNPCNFFS